MSPSDGKRSLGLDSVGQAAELGNELGPAISRCEISVCHELFLEKTRLLQRGLTSVSHLMADSNRSRTSASKSVIRSQTGTCSRAKHLRLRTTVVIGPRDEPPYRLRSREVDLLVADVAWRGCVAARFRNRHAHLSNCCSSTMRNCTNSRRPYFAPADGSQLGVGALVERQCPTESRGLKAPRDRPLPARGAGTASAANARER
jgi:hypothetical protein